MMKVTDLGFRMDELLEQNLNSYVHNVKHKDFDFVFIISGDGMTRVGKTMLAQQIGYYCAYRLGTPFTVENILFEPDELFGVPDRFPIKSVIMYDEARESLDAKNWMTKIAKKLGSFFDEVGMLNNIYILVLPNYFDLQPGLALSRSELLINVIRTIKDAKDEDGREVQEYGRGVLEYFNRMGKSNFYNQGKMKKEYYNLSAKHRFFYAHYEKFWTVDTEAYTTKKLAFLRRVRMEESKEKNVRVGAVLKLLCNYMTQREAAKLLSDDGYSITQPRINQLIGDYTKQKANMNLR